MDFLIVSDGLTIRLGPLRRRVSARQNNPRAPTLFAGSGAAWSFFRRGKLRQASVNLITWPDADERKEPKDVGSSVFGTGIPRSNNERPTSNGE